MKLTALGAKNLAALCLALASENQKLAGKTSMKKLLKSGKELRVFDVQEQDLSAFATAAKQYGVLFTVIKHSQDGNGHVDVITKAEDVSKLNRILEKMDYAVPEQGDSEPKKADPRVRQESRSAERGTGWMPENQRTTDPHSIRAKIQQIKIRQEKMPVEPVLPGKEKSR
ncbi:MAG: PcfB family protein [Oscillospiraceae bacterium]|nr:PcfB family protein [Oscillospiraceae bacterium]